MEKINNKQSKKTENSDKKNIAQLKKSIAVIGWIILFAAVILIFDYMVVSDRERCEKICSNCGGYEECHDCEDRCWEEMREDLRDI